MLRKPDKLISYRQSNRFGSYLQIAVLAGSLSQLEGKMRVPYQGRSAPKDQTELYLELKQEEQDRYRMRRIRLMIYITGIQLALM